MPQINYNKATYIPQKSKLTAVKVSKQRLTVICQKKKKKTLGCTLEIVFFTQQCRNYNQTKSSATDRTMKPLRRPRLFKDQLGLAALIWLSVMTFFFFLPN